MTDKNKNSNSNNNNNNNTIFNQSKSNLDTNCNAVNLKHLDLIKQQQVQNEVHSELDELGGNNSNQSSDPTHKRHSYDLNLHKQHSLPPDKNWLLSKPAFHKHVSDTPKWIVIVTVELWKRGKKWKNQNMESFSGQHVVDILMKILNSNCPDRDQILGVCQLLLNEGAIKQVPNNEQEQVDEKFEFYDRSDIFYNCVCELKGVKDKSRTLTQLDETIAHMDKCKLGQDEYMESYFKYSKNKSILDGIDEEDGFEILINRLIRICPEALVRKSLQKPPSERTKTELAMIDEELMLVPSLASFSLSVRQELGKCIKYEIHPDKHKAVFYQGDLGTSWYIIYRGSVWVHVDGQGYVCQLNEGDDFGKLALITDSPRAASIVLAESYCHFLKVNKNDFNRILLNMEANTVRLKKNNSDVLILEHVPDTGAYLRTTNIKTHPTTSLHLVPCPISTHMGKTCPLYSNYVITAGTLEQIIFYLLDNHLDGYECKLESLIRGDLLSIHLYAQLIPNDLDQAWMNLFLTLRLHSSTSQLLDILRDYCPVIGQFHVDSLITTINRYGRLIVLFYIWRFVIGLYEFANNDNIQQFLESYYNSFEKCVSGLPTQSETLVVVNLINDLTLYLKSLKTLIDDNKKFITIQTRYKKCHSKVRNTEFKNNSDDPSFHNSTIVDFDNNNSHHHQQQQQEQEPEQEQQHGTPFPTFNLQRCRSSITRRTINGWHKVAKPFLGDTRLQQHLQNYSNLKNQLPVELGIKGLNYHIHRKNQIENKSTLQSRIWEVLFGYQLHPPLLPLIPKHHTITLGVFLSDLYCPIKITVPIEMSVLELKQSIVHRFDMSQFEIKDLRLVEVLTNGDWTVFRDHECGIMFGLSPNGKLFLSSKTRLQSLMPLAKQLVSATNFLHQTKLDHGKLSTLGHIRSSDPNSIPNHHPHRQDQMSCKLLDEFSMDELATTLTYSHLQLAICIQPQELLDNIISSNDDKFHNPTPHIQTLIRRFSLLNMWTVTQIVTTFNLNRRANFVRKLIKLANCFITTPLNDLYSCLAVVLGLQNNSVTRLIHTWERVPNRWKRLFNDRLMPLIDPSKNHRAARNWASTLHNQSHLPFLALILKDLRFGEDANQTKYKINPICNPQHNGSADLSDQVQLVNFEKMRLMARSLKLWTRALGCCEYLHPYAKSFGAEFNLNEKWISHAAYQKFSNVSHEYQLYILENMECIDDPKVLDQLSLRLEPKK